MMRNLSMGGTEEQKLALAWTYFGALQERGVADIFQYALMAERACETRGDLVDLFQRKIMVPHWQTSTTLHNVRSEVLSLSLAFARANMIARAF